MECYRIVLTICDPTTDIPSSLAYSPIHTRQYSRFKTVFESWDGLRLMYDLHPDLKSKKSQKKLTGTGFGVRVDKQKDSSLIRTLRQSDIEI